MPALLDDALSKLCASAGTGQDQALGLLSKIIGNIIDAPGEAKFRRLNPESAKLKSALLSHEGAEQVLTLGGFKRTADGAFELPAGAEAKLPELRAKVEETLKVQSQKAHRKSLIVAPASAPAQETSSPEGAAYREVVDGGAQGAGLAEAAVTKAQPGGVEALQLLERVLVNIRRYSDNDKYRSVNLAKASGQKILPAVPLMMIAGFEQTKLASGEECMKLVRFNTDVLERVGALIYWSTRPDPAPALPAPASLSSRALGAVLGAVIGDALGAPLGGRGPLEVTAAEVDKAMEMCGGGIWGVAPGQITGCTELTVCLAEALAEVKDVVRSGLPLDEVALRYGRWGRSLPFRVERASGQVFQKARAGSDMAERAKEVNQKAMGSGPLARSLPVAAVAAAAGAPAAAASLAREDASLSHPNSAVGVADAAYALTAAALIAGSGDPKAAIEQLQAWLSHEQAKPGGAADDSRGPGWTHLSRGEQPRVQNRGAPAKDEKAWEPPGEKLVAVEVVTGWLNKAFGAESLPFSDYSHMALTHGEVGSVEIPLTHAFRHLHRGTGFEEAMRSVLAGGGDSCATAAAVGGLLGARLGVEGIPPRWIQAVLTCDVSLGQARPPEYQPSALPELLGKICSGAA